MIRTLHIPERVSTAADRLQTAFRAWYGEAVFLPFAGTRLVWLLVAAFAPYFPSSETFRRYINQGGFISQHYWLDIWARWDSRWYMLIITKGYFKQSADFVTTHFSNLPFFPLYPYLVKGISKLIPFRQGASVLYLLIGVVLSNLFFLVAAGLIYRLIADHIADESIAKRAVLLLCLFPTAFFFSCFYPESLFLMLSAASLLLAYRKRWLLASLAGGLLAITRPQGILIVAPLVLLYFQSVGWKVRNIRPNLAWQALIPIPLALHFVSLYPTTGSLIAPILAQQPWREGGSVLTEVPYLLNLKPALNVWQMDGVIWVLFALILLVGVWRLRSWPLGIYTLLQLVLPVSTGTVFSFSRFAVGIFPAFIMLAGLLKKRWMEWIVLAVFFAFQVMYFLGWVNYFWIA